MKILAKFATHLGITLPHGQQDTGLTQTSPTSFNIAHALTHLKLTQSAYCGHDVYLSQPYTVDGFTATKVLYNKANDV